MITRHDLLRSAPLVALAAALATRARAQQEHAGHGAGSGDASPATEGYMAAVERMHQDMAVALSGDPDVDFARSMIPHHQGAIDMARVMLEHGQDPELRSLAELVIAAQEAEIAVLNDWLARNGG